MSSKEPIQKYKSTLLASSLLINEPVRITIRPTTKLKNNRNVFNIYFISSIFAIVYYTNNNLSKALDWGFGFVRVKNEKRVVKSETFSGSHIYMI